MPIKNKQVLARDAVALIQDGDTLCTSGFVGTGTPEELIMALEERFLETGSPRDLTLVFAAAPGDGIDQGVNRLAHKGLIRRVIGGHWALVPKIVEMAVANEIEAYNLPMGTIAQLFREIAAGRPGVITKVGLGTFVDPRQTGGKLNSRTAEDLVELIDLNGEEWLFFKAFPIDVAFVRGTTSDPAGNLTFEKEAVSLDNLAIAMAAKNSHGFVAAQVERMAGRKTLDSRKVQVPRILVDCVVRAKTENHRQTYGTQYNPMLSGELKADLDSMLPMPLDERKIIARRAAFELPMGGIINLGIGMPEGVARVANEENLLDHITLTAEAGVIGGFPQGGLDFGSAINTDAVIQQNQQFDFYDGGGLDMASLGMAQVDGNGHVNVSLFGTRIAGAGGFINISQNASSLVFAGTFTTKGLKIDIDSGKLKIVQEGTRKKFVNQVQQITFNGQLAAEKLQRVFYVTERCVFRLRKEGLELIEIAPGVDIEKDILAQMDFRPIIESPPRLMAPEIFQPMAMGLDIQRLARNFDDRISYDTDRNLLFLNLEGHRFETSDDVEVIREVLESTVKNFNQKVDLVANFNGCSVNPAIMDSLMTFRRHMENHYISRTVDYSTSAFMRVKLGEELAKRKVKPHVFEGGF